MHRLDRIIVETPGGGGWGTPSKEEEEKEARAIRRAKQSWMGSNVKGSLAERHAAQLGA